MFVSNNNIYCSRCPIRGKQQIKRLTSKNKSKRSKYILTIRNNMGLVDTVIQETTDADRMLEDITIESSSTVESVGSGDSGTTVLEMDISGHKTNCHHMGGTSAHVH